MQVLAACAAGQAGDTVLCRYKITPDPKGWESVVTEQEGEGELIPQLTQNVDFQSAPEFPLQRGQGVPLSLGICPLCTVHGWEGMSSVECDLVTALGGGGSKVEPDGVRGVFQP